MALVWLHVAFELVAFELVAFELVAFERENRYILFESYIYIFIYIVCWNEYGSCVIVVVVVVVLTVAIGEVVWLSLSGVIPQHDATAIRGCLDDIILLRVLSVASSTIHNNNNNDVSTTLE